MSETLLDTLTDDVAGAISRLTGLSPKLLMDVAEDPEAAKPVYRVWQLSLAAIMMKRAVAPDFPDSLRLKLIDSLGKFGAGVQDNTLTAANLPQITINVPIYQGDRPVSKLFNLQPIDPTYLLEGDVYEHDADSAEIGDDGDG